MALPFHNFQEIKMALHEVLSHCNRFSKTLRKDDILESVFLTLEIASKLVSPADRPKKRENLPNTGITNFHGLYKYYQQRLITNMAEVNEFVTVLLPFIVRLALEVEDGFIGIPLNVESEEFAMDLLLHTDCPPIGKVFEVKICRSHLATALACQFLCLVLPPIGELTCPNDFTTFYAYFDGNKSRPQLAKYLMILSYFRSLASKGLPSGCMTFRKLVICEDQQYDLCKWRNRGATLCPFEVRSRGGIDDEQGTVIQTNFADNYLGGNVLTEGNAREELLFSSRPELLASLLFITRMRTLEAVQIEGFDTFSTFAGRGDCTRFVGPYCRPDEDKRVAYMTAIDAWNFSHGASRQYEQSYVVRELNKAFVGFLQPHNPGGPLNLPPLKAAAENLAIATKKAEVKLAEFNERQRLVPWTEAAVIAVSHGRHVPILTKDLPGIEPLTKAEKKRARQAGGFHVEDHTEINSKETVKASTDFISSEDLSAIHNYADSLTEKLMGDIRANLKLVIPDYFGFTVVHYDSLKEQNDPENNTETTNNDENSPNESKMDTTDSPTLRNILEEEASSVADFADSVAADVVRESLSSVCNKPKPVQLSRGAVRILPKVEVTTLTSNPSLPLSVNVDVSVTHGQKNPSPSLVTTANVSSHAIDVELSATASTSQNMEVEMDVTESPNPNIDIRIEVSSSTLSLASFSSPRAISASLDSSEMSNSVPGCVAELSRSPSQTSTQSVFSQCSLSDSVKHHISQKAQSLSHEILSSAYDELRERRRLFIENNISSVDFEAARNTSTGLIGQIFDELQEEAENSISDAEKLRKDEGQVETYAEGLVSEVITEAQAEWLPSTVTYKAGSSSDAHLTVITSPIVLQADRMLTVPPRRRVDVHSRGQLNRRSSAPGASVRKNLESLTRRVSEPAVLFRSRSPHATDYGTRLSDYIKQEFEMPKRGMSASTLSPTSSRTSTDPLWTEFNRRGSGGKSPGSRSGSLRSPKSDKRPSLAHQALPSCEEEDMISPTDGLGPSSRAPPTTTDRQASLILPAVTINSAGDSDNPDQARSNGVDDVYMDLSPPVSPIQHQYLQLYSEVLAENILHESLEKVQKQIDQSQSCRQIVSSNKEEASGNGKPSAKGKRAIATGNWGCGTFKADPQLKSMIQWISATAAYCPQLIYYTCNDERIEGLAEIVDLLQFSTTDTLMDLLLKYCNHQTSSTECRSLFTFIKRELSCQ